MLSADFEATSFDFGLTDGLGMGVDTLHYEIGVLPDAAQRCSAQDPRPTSGGRGPDALSASRGTKRRLSRVTLRAVRDTPAVCVRAGKPRVGSGMRAATSASRGPPRAPLCTANTNGDRPLSGGMLDTRNVSRARA